jgi:hypothetical protein
VAFLAESNTFLERFIVALDALPSTGDTAADQKEMMAKLLKHMQRYEALRKSLKLLRDKVGQEATNKDVRKEASDARKEEGARERAKAAKEFFADQAIRFRVVRGDNAWVPVGAAPGLRPNQRLEAYYVSASDYLCHDGTVKVVGEVQNTYHLQCVKGRIGDHHFLCPPDVAPPPITIPPDANARAGTPSEPAKAASVTSAGAAAKRPLDAGQPHLVVEELRGDLARVTPRNGAYVYLGRVYPCYEKVNGDGEPTPTGWVRVVGLWPDLGYAVVRRINGNLTIDSVVFPRELTRRS